MPIPVTAETLYGSLDFLNEQKGQEHFLHLIKWLMRTEVGASIVASIFLEAGARWNDETDEGVKPFFEFINEASRSGDSRISMVILQLAFLMQQGTRLAQAQGDLHESIAQLQQALPTEPVVDDMLLAAKNIRQF